MDTGGESTLIDEAGIQDMSENYVSRGDVTRQKTAKTKAETKLDLLPNEPPRRSRLEVLALPKSRPNEKNEPRLSSLSGARHQFTGVSNANHSRKASINQRGQQNSVDDIPNSARASELASRRLNVSNATKASRKEQPHVPSQETTQLLSARASSLKEPQSASRRTFSYRPRMNLTMQQKVQVKKIRAIALYRDRVPIIGLKKRNFPQSIAEKHAAYPFVPNLNPDEYPFQAAVTDECPTCRRTFCQEVFPYHVQRMCKPIFLSRR